MESLKMVVVLIMVLGCSARLNRTRRTLHMAVDVIRSFHRPTAVVAKICWEKSDKLHLATELMNADNAKSITFIDSFEIVEKYNAEDMLIMIDLKCDHSELFLKNAEKGNRFKKPYRWFVLPGNGNTSVPLEFKNLKILIDSDVIVADDVNDETLLNMVYRIDSTSKFIKEAFGTWNLLTGLKLSKEVKTSISMRRKNLHGKSITMSVVTVNDRAKSKAELYNLNNLVTDNLAKSTFHNILPLYDFMNATTELIFADTWGYYINNSWNGMIGQIKSGEADFCGTISIMRTERMEVLSFLTQPIHISASFVFRDPPLSLQNNLFILPFKSTVWMCIGGLVLLLIFILYANAKWEVVKKGDAKYEDPTILRANFSDIAIFVAGAVVQQGGNSELKGFRGRIVTFIMFLIFLFLYTSYAANIVALLQSSSDQIRTLSDLLNSKLELGVEDQPYTRHYFTTATERVRKSIYDSKVVRTGYKPNFMPIEEGVKKLQNIGEPFAFHMNLGLGYRFVEQSFHEHEKCGLREIEYIPNGSPWICCRAQTPYKEIYKVGLARVLEHGIGDRINRMIYARKPSCTSRGGNFGSVNMMDFHPVLLCLLYGIITSVLILFLEILVYIKQQRNKSTRRSITSISNSSDSVESF